MTVATSRAAVSEAREVTAFITLAVLGGSIFLAMPVIISTLRHSFGFSDRQSGEFASVQLIFISIGCFASLVVSRSHSAFRLGRYALLTLMFMDALSPFSRAYPVFLAVRAIAGLAGGLLISLTTGALARTTRPDRNFGFYLFAQIAFSTVSLYVLPKIELVWGIRGVFLALVALEGAALLLALPALPKVPVVTDRRARDPIDAYRWGLWGVLLLSVFTFFVGVGSFWTYAARIGEEAGLGSAPVGRALSLAMVGGLLGALLPIVLQARFGRALPVLAATLAALVGLAIAGQALTIARYMAACALFCFGWYLLFPYQMGVLGSLDRDGRPSMAAAALSGVGLGVGPLFVAGYLGYGVSVAAVIAAVGTALAGTLALSAIATDAYFRRPARAGAL